MMWSLCGRVKNRRWNPATPYADALRASVAERCPHVWHSGTSHDRLALVRVLIYFRVRACEDKVRPQLPEVGGVGG